jgi:hypothetical protein
MLTALMLATSLNLLANECLTHNLGCQPDNFCKISEHFLGNVEGVSYGLTHYCDGKRHKLVLKARPQVKREADWHEVDRLYITFDEKKFVLDIMGLCRMDGKTDPELLAIVRSESVEYRRAVKGMASRSQTEKTCPRFGAWSGL